MLEACRALEVIGARRPREVVDVLRVEVVFGGAAGGSQATFTQQVDASSGRVDIAIIRPSDATGAAGTGLVAAILFDAVGAGPANFSVTGTAAAPGGAPAALQLAPVAAVTVR